MTQFSPKSPKRRAAFSGMMATGMMLGATMGATPSPNVMVILADDIGAHELGVYGHPTHQTPHLDRLAREGIYFETAYALPVCHPSRHALMTGQYPHRNGVFHFPHRGGGPPLEDRGDDNIANHLTFGQLFQQAGYATAMAGKWQLSGELPNLIRETGFDEYSMWAYRRNLPPGAENLVGYESGPGARTSRYWHPSIIENGEHRPTTINDYGPDRFTDFLIDFSQRNHAECDKPFFLYYSMALTHEPYYPTPGDHPVDETKFKKDPANWRSNVEYMDTLVGRLVAALEANGQRDNTLIVFMGDNGTSKFGKGDTTEMGARVPLIFNGPGLVKPQGRSPELVDITDIFPTICAVAGIRGPPDHFFDGVSLAPYLRGETTPLREWIYAPLGGRRTLRTKRWLLENNTPWQFGQLYDCGESRDGTGYRVVTHDSSPEVVAAKKHLLEILTALPVPEVFRNDPRLRGRERPHYLMSDELQKLNSPAIIELWPEGVPNQFENPPAEEDDGHRKWSITHPTLTVYPASNPVQGAPLVIVCPGGGYHKLSWQNGGIGVAKWLNSLGITVFVLKYRLHEYGHPAPLQDVQRAMRLVRSRAEQFGGTPDNIGISGASAGGHLAASLGTLHDLQVTPEGDTLEEVSARPDFMMLLYPVITMDAPHVHVGSRRGLLGDTFTSEQSDLLSLEKQVSADVPPAFIVATNQDAIVDVENSVLFHQALKNAGVPSELHLFEEGAHGFGVVDLEGPKGAWPILAEAWMKHRGFLPKAETE